MKFNAFILTALLIVMGLPCLSSATMSSASYRIPTSVLSGGGIPMGSAGFQTNATLGQSSPLMPASSAGFDLYPGFWYTLAISGCIWDFEPDGDVDGVDLETFIQGFGPPGYNASELENFGTEFGRTDCF